MAVSRTAWGGLAIHSFEALRKGTVCKTVSFPASEIARPDVIDCGIRPYMKSRRLRCAPPRPGAAPGQHAQAPPDQSAHPPAQDAMLSALPRESLAAGRGGAPGRQVPRPRGQRCGRLYAARMPASACRAGSVSAISSSGSASSELTCRNLPAPSRRRCRDQVAASGSKPSCPAIAMLS